MALKLSNGERAHASMTRHFTYELEWIPENQYIAGTEIQLRSGCLRSLIEWRYVKLDMDKADIKYRCRPNPTISDHMRNTDCIIFSAKLPYGVKVSEKCRILITAIPPIWAGVNEKLSIWIKEAKKKKVAGDEESLPFIREKGSDCELTVDAGPVERFSVYSKPMLGPNGQIRTCLVPEDRYGNPSKFVHSMKISLCWEGMEWNEHIQGAKIIYLDPPNRVGRLSALIDMNSLALCENISNGSRQEKSFLVAGNPVWTDSQCDLLAAFGEIHWHTQYSGDGDRSIDDALFCARDYLNMDFAAPGDHNTRGKGWEETVDALDRYNTKGVFATFYGWENSSSIGHENYYFTDPNHPLICHGRAGIKGGPPHGLVNKLKQYEDFIAIPHHTNSIAETRDLDNVPYWHPYQWTNPTNYIQLVEIMQTRGNQECNVYEDMWRGWYQYNHSSVQDALGYGYKLGFVGGTDNHCGWPGRAYAIQEGGAIHGTKSVILTGIWTKSIERNSVFDALRQRHTWAVWDTRAIVIFKINQALMGEEVHLPAGEELNAYICISAEDVFQCVDIVSEGKAVWSSSFTSLDIEENVPLGLVKETTHFYLRALLRNGGIIYASPVFVNVDDGGGDSKV